MEREEHDGGRSIKSGGHQRARDGNGRSIAGGRSIERGGHPRARDCRGRNIDGSVGIIYEGESIKRREHQMGVE